MRLTPLWMSSLLAGATGLSLSGIALAGLLPPSRPCKPAPQPAYVPTQGTVFPAAPPGQVQILPPMADEPAPPAPSPAQECETARKAIQAVLDAQVAAWNRRDLEGFMAGYWNSPELSFFSGKVQTRGWKATLQRYRQRYQAGGKEMGKLRFETVVIDVLAPDFALVRGRWQLEMKKENPGGLFTLLFRKQPEGWKIVHDHTSS